MRQVAVVHEDLDLALEDDVERRLAEHNGVHGKGARYTPVSKRGEKPDAIAYLIKNYPELLDAQISRLLGTTKETIAKVRERSHWNAQNIKPHSPVILGLCKQADLEAAVKRAQRRLARAQAAKGGAPIPAVEEGDEDQDQGGFIHTASAQQDEQPDIDHDAMVRGLG